MPGKPAPSLQPTIIAHAPCRADLAGGTIDLWPLYLFHPGALTVNFAVEILTTCRVSPLKGQRIELCSVDTQREEAFANLNELIASRRHRHVLAAYLVRFFAPDGGLRVETDSQSPAGAGISGSSALAIALIGALNSLVGNRYERRQFIGIAANIETTVIKVPAGLQDYYPAFFGSTSCIHLDPDGVDREPLEIDESEIERRFVICYTGEPRHSGINNWEMFKRHIEGDQEVFMAFERIRDAAVNMRAALLANDWDAVAETMRAAYPNRKRLAPGITTPHMDHLVETALANGAEAAKVCGAGGGGCIAFLCAEGRKPDVERALVSAGGEILQWKVAREGLLVKES